MAKPSNEIASRPKAWTLGSADPLRQKTAALRSPPEDETYRLYDRTLGFGYLDP